LTHDEGDPKERFFIDLGIRFRRIFGREMTAEERRYFTLAEQATRQVEAQGDGDGEAA